MFDWAINVDRTVQQGCFKSLTIVISDQLDLCIHEFDYNPKYALVVRILPISRSFMLTTVVSPLARIGGGITEGQYVHKTLFS